MTRNLFIISIALLYIHSFGYGQIIEPDLPPKQYFGVPVNFSHDFVREKTLNSLQGKSYGEYKASFADEIAAIPEYYTINGWTMENMGDWVTALEATASKFMDTQDESLEVNIMITRDPEFNAYATAAGYVFFNIGLLADAQSYEQIIMVLGHEMGHNLSHHAFEGHVDMKKAQTQALAASVFGSIAGMIGTAMANKSYLSHSREDESEADDYAIDMMSKANYDLEAARSFYDLASMVQLNYKWKYGVNSGHWFYGSSHPSPTDRSTKIEEHIQANPIPSAPDNFKALQLEARYEMMHSLCAYADYRKAIERGWSYLMEDPENEVLEGLLFDAVRRFLIVQPNAYNEHVLTYAYKMPDEMKDAIHLNNTNDEAASLAVRSLLLASGGLENSPFPVGITFGELKETLRDRLAGTEDAEIKFVLALDEPFDPGELSSYKNEAGSFADFVRLYPERIKHAQRTLLVPDVLQFAPPPGYFEGPGYTEIMNKNNWQLILDYLKKVGFESELVRKDQLTEMSPYYWEMNRRLEALIANGWNGATIEIYLLDPELGRFLLEENIGGFISLDAYPGTNALQVGIYHLNLKDQELKYSKGPTFAMSLGDDLMYKVFKKRYKKLQKE